MNQTAGRGELGSIPACAGEPSARRQLIDLPEVYPRVCGGTIQIVESESQVMGLSPRVRGNPERKPKHPNASGSIPACAGEPRQGAS